jgi:hypothetical protein
MESLAEQENYYGGGIDFDSYLEPAIVPDVEKHLFIELQKRIFPDYVDVPVKEKWLGPKHMFYVNKSKIFEFDDESCRCRPTGRLTKENYAYLWFPHIGKEGDDEYISRDSVYRSMKIIYALWLKKPKGWIIDLRANTGGIVEYFIAALSQFVDDFELIGYDRKGKQNSSIVGRNNTFKMSIEGEIVFDLEFPFKIDINTDNINVLIDENTASAAEIIAILLKKYRNAKIYGQDSFGVVSLMLNASLRDYNFVFPVSKISFEGEEGKIKPDIYGIPEHLYPI